MSSLAVRCLAFGFSAFVIIGSSRPIAAQPCVADCNADGAVTIDEVALGVRIALGEIAPTSCPRLDADGDGRTAVDDVVTAITNLLTPWSQARVDVGGHSLRIRCVGQGSPVVVLDAGYAGTTQDWRLVLPQLEGVTRTCAYNRAGYAGSEPGPQPRDAEQVVAELNALLTNGCLPQKYVLVGHSLGAFHVRLFASEHPEKVAGLITVDGSQEDFADRLRNEVSAELVASVLDRSVDPSLGVLYLENEAFIHFDPAELRSSGPLPVVPFTLLVAGRALLPEQFAIYQEATDALWLELQEHLASTVPGSVLHVVPDSGHYIHLDRPDVVIEAITSMVEAIRAGSTK